MKKLLAILIVLWGGGAASVWYWNQAHSKQVAFRTVEVRRGDLAASINATGTLEPEEVVDVGAQVAGLIQSFGADPDDSSKPISYGSRVEEGTILAKLDASLFKARVDQAKASLDRAKAGVEVAEAKLRRTERDLERNRRLRSKGEGMVAAQELDTAVADYEAAKATLSVSQSEVEVAEADLEEATVSLGYTTIRSPVKGMILDRRVNIGQTVVASLNAPSLFLIAKDLRKLEIWASVNETDVGAIHPGQEVQFTVGAFPNRTFTGKVAQIRLNASMVQSVVTYTVVISVDNSDNELLPYLTARIQFQVERRTGVLLVPNAALRWRPEMAVVLPEARGEYAKAQHRRARGESEGGHRPGEGAAASSEGLLWVQSGEFVEPIAVAMGLTDGVVTEVSGSRLKEGLHVVTGVIRQQSLDDAATILPHTQIEKSKRETSK